MNKPITVLVSFLACNQLAAQIDAGLFRYPDVSKTQIAFSYANDIWIMPKEGATAKGTDPQLEPAIAKIINLLKTKGFTAPPVPPVEKR
jgi:hypothetical protein